MLRNFTPQANSDLQQLFETKRGTKIVIDDFETTTAWTVTSGTIDNDTANYKEGTQGVKWIANNGSTDARRTDLSLNASNHHFEFWMYIDNISNMDTSQGIEVMFGNVSAGAYFYCNLYPNDIQTSGWSKMALSRAQFNLYNVVDDDWADIRGVRISVKSKADVTVNVTFDQLIMVEDIYPARITIRLDDGYLTHYEEAYPRMKTYGYKASDGVVTDHIGVYSNRMNLTHLKTLQNEGWDIMSHTKTHAALTSLNSSALTTELEQSQQWLLNNGFTKGARFLISPGNGFNSTTLDYIDNYYLAHNCMRKFYNVYPPPDEYRTGFFLMDEPETEATIKGWIDKAVKFKAWLVLYSHEVSNNKPTLVTNATKFGNIMAYINSKGVQVQTFSEIYDQLTNLDEATTSVKLFHSTGNITNINYASGMLTFTVSASGTTSTTKVYCGDKGEPTQVYTLNGTLTWSYNASTRILTLNVLHSGSANIVVDWRIPGDVDGDGYVGSAGFSILAVAYGSSAGDPSYDIRADFDGDGYVGSADFSILAGNYGKTA